MRKSTLTLRHLLCAVLLTSATSPAQSQIAADEEEQEEIVVTGIRRGAEPIRDKAVAFVRKVSARPVDGQFARWHEPVCPNTKGLSDQHAAIVVQSIKQIARDAGATVGAGDCRPNIVITFTTKAASFMKILLKRQPTLFSQVERDDRTVLFNSDLPVRWWYTTHTEGSDGHQIGATSSALINMTDFPTPKSGKFLDSYHSTLIGTKLHVNLRSVGVVVDIDAATGSTLKGLSAYIAMVALTPTKLTADYSDVPSILAMFPLDGSSSRQDLSEWDRAYLSSAYKIPADRTSRVQRSLIVGQMIRRIDR